jgi:hypothetical protein
MPNSRVDRPRRGPNNLFADVGSVAMLALLRPGGWLGSGLDYLWEKGPGLVWLAGFALVLGGAAFKRVFFPRRTAADQSDLLLYFCVALGVFFLFRLLVTGSL